MNNVHPMLTREEAAKMAKMAAAQCHPPEHSETKSLSSGTQPNPDGDIFTIQHEMSPSAMILQGVELENDQCIF